MMDDVVGLVMVQVISNLGGGDIDPITVVRPVLVSLAFAVVVPLVCYFIIRPLTVLLNSQREARSSGKLQSILGRKQTPLVIHTLLLVGLITGASYAGTSNLFAAYIAGTVVSWWDSEPPHPAIQHHAQRDSDAIQKGKFEHPQMPTEASRQQSGHVQPHSEPGEDSTGSAIYEQYYQQAVSRILQPFFFASIGFSIPISRMFSGSIVWRGLVYAILMMVGKLVCGLWLVRLPLTSVGVKFRSRAVKLKFHIPHLWGRRVQTGEPSTLSNSEAGTDETTEHARDAAPRSRRVSRSSVPNVPSRSPSSAPKPLSLHPPLILAMAMTARGEIGFLISAVAESKGVFSSGQKGAHTESDIFLIVTWAIVLCTMIGPLCVGLLVRRVKSLEWKREKEAEGTGSDLLGVWGVK
jgi:hypothetical protein